MARTVRCYHNDNERGVLAECESCRFLWDELARLEATLRERGVLQAPHPSLFDGGEEPATAPRSPLAHSMLFGCHGNTHYLPCPTAQAIQEAGE